MTVCIGVVCDGGKAIVVAADRMFTNPGLSVEFETTEKKIENLAERCVVLAAGNSVHATEVLSAVKQQLGGNSTPAIDQVAELIRAAYEVVRAKKARQSIIMATLGADFAQYEAIGLTLPAYLEKQPGMFQQLAMVCQQYNLGTEFLVAGLDGVGAHLSHVSNPGVVSQVEKLGHAAIGSGGAHALIRLSLVGQTRQRNLVDTLADVYSAKRVAEVSPGVGNATDIAVIDEKKGVWHCTEGVLAELEKVHQAASEKQLPNLTALKAKFDEQHA